MNQLVAGIDNCAMYINDLVVFSDTWADYLVQLKSVGSLIGDLPRTRFEKKYEFFKAHVQYLGYILGQGKVCPLLTKVGTIAKISRPEQKRGLQRFLGMFGYYRWYVTHFSDVIPPLLNYYGKGKGSNGPLNDSQATKDLLTNRPILHSPDFKRHFKIATDASNPGAGSVLLQTDHNDVDHPIRKFNSAQQNYSVVEKDLLAIILALQFFSAYLPPSGPVYYYLYRPPPPEIFG